MQFDGCISFTVRIKIFKVSPKLNNQFPVFCSVSSHSNPVVCTFRFPLHILFAGQLFLCVCCLFLNMNNFFASFSGGAHKNNSFACEYDSTMIAAKRSSMNKEQSFEKSSLVNKDTYSMLHNNHKPKGQFLCRLNTNFFHYFKHLSFRR
jgi:hypothetical protein